MSQNISWTATVNTTGAVGPLKELQGQFTATQSAANQSASGFNAFSTSANTSATAARNTQSAVTPLGSSFSTTGSAATGLHGAITPLSPALMGVASGGTSTTNAMNPLSGALAGAGTQAKTTTGAMSPLGSAMKETSAGGLTLNNTLQPMPGLMNQTATGASNATTSHTKWTTALKENALGLSLVASSAIGLVSGLTSLEAAHVSLERAQLRQNTAALAVQKAQDTLAKDTVKYGADSRKVAEDEANLANKREALRVATERAGLMQTKYNEQVAEFASNIAPSLITLGGSIAQVWSNLRGATVAASVGQEAAAATAGEAALAETALGASGGAAAAGEEGAAVGARSLTMSLGLVAIAAVAAIALFALIETNTFGLGDAFRATTTVVAQAIDTMIGAVLTFAKYAVLSFQNIGTGILNALGTIQSEAEAAWSVIVQSARSFAVNLVNAMAGIVNGVIQYVINPVIGAWNTFLAGLEAAWATVTSKLIEIFRPIGAAILGGFLTLVGGIKGALNAIGRHDLDAAFQALTEFNTNLTKTQTTATTTGGAVKGAFKDGIPTLPLINTQLQDTGVHMGVLQSRFTGIIGPTAAFNESLTPVKVNLAESAAQTVNYYSKQENLTKLLQGASGPAIKFVSGLFQQLSGILGGAVTPSTNEAAAATDKHAGALKNASAVISDYGNKVAELSKKNADLANALAHGRELQDAWNMGVQTASQVLLKLAGDTAEVWGQVAKYNEALQSGQLYLANYNKGLADGALKFTDLIAKTANAVGQQNEYNALLDQTVGKFELFNGTIEKTPANLELVMKGLLGDKDAMKQLQDQANQLMDAFNKLGDDVAKTLGDALQKGRGSWNKALKDLAKDTGVSFDLLKHDMSLKVAAGMDEAKNSLQKDLGLMNVMIRGNSPNIESATEQMIGGLSKEILKAHGTITPQWQDIFTQMRKIAAAPMDVTSVSNAFGRIQADLKAMGIPAAQAQQIMAALAPGIRGVGTSATAAAPPVDQLGQTLDGLKAQQLAAITVVNMWGVALSGVAQIFNVRFKQAVNDAAGYLNALNAQIHAFVTDALVNSLTKGIENAAKAANDNFKAMMNNVNTHLVGMLNAIRTFVTTGLVNSLEKGAQNSAKIVDENFKAMMNNVSIHLNGMVTAIQTFVRTGLINSLELGVTQAQRTVATAFNAMLSSVRTTTGQMITLIHNLINTIKTVPTTWTTSFLGNVSSLSSAVSQAKNLINSVPTSHTTTLYIRTIRTVVTVPAGPAPVSTIAVESAAVPGMESSYYAGGGGGGGGYSPQLDTIIMLLKQIAGRDTIITLDGKEIGRLVRRHIFENVGALT